MTRVELMRAVVQTGIGGPEVLQLQSRPMPRDPLGDEVLIKLKACGVCYHDLLVRDGRFRHFVELPLVPGHEMAGDVLAIGKSALRVKVGDQVASTNRETCGQCNLCRSGQVSSVKNRKANVPAFLRPKFHIFP